MWVPHSVTRLILCLSVKIKWITDLHLVIWPDLSSNTIGWVAQMSTAIPHLLVSIHMRVSGLTVRILPSPTIQLPTSNLVRTCKNIGQVSLHRRIKRGQTQSATLCISLVLIQATPLKAQTQSKNWMNESPSKTIRPAKKNFLSKYFGEWAPNPTGNPR